MDTPNIGSSEINHLLCLFCKSFLAASVKSAWREKCGLLWKRRCGFSWWTSQAVLILALRSQVFLSNFSLLEMSTTCWKGRYAETRWTSQAVLILILRSQVFLSNTPQLETSGSWLYYSLKKKIRRNPMDVPGRFNPDLEESSISFKHPTTWNVWFLVLLLAEKEDTPKSQKQKC